MHFPAEITKPAVEKKLADNQRTFSVTGTGTIPDYLRKNLFIWFHGRTPFRNAGVDAGDGWKEKPLYQNIHVIALTALLLRVLAVLASDFIHYPDEIFQYLEQGHRLAFGYGNIPWEYRHGVRSWILPGLISVLLQPFRIPGLDNPHIYVPAIKIFFSALSVSCIYASFVIVRKFSSERAALVAAWFTCFWYELIYFAGKATPETLAAYCLVSALALAVSQPGAVRAACIGFLCVFSTALRLQYLPLALIVLVFSLFQLDRPKRIGAMVVFLAGIALAGLLDYVTWGGFWASYYLNYRYNVVYRISWYFGMQSRLYYINALRLSSGGLFLLVLPPSLLPSLIKKTWLPLLCVLAVIVPHSLPMHKEYRFMFAAIPFFCMLTAVVLTDGLAGIGDKSHLGRNLTAYVLTALLLISLSGMFRILPDQSEIYRPLISRDDILPAYLFLHDEPGLAAVYNAYGPWFYSGGFYYLHRNVPVYYPDNLAAIAQNDYRSLVSHIVCSSGFPPVPGFTPVFRSGDLEIRKNVAAPPAYRSLNLDTQNMIQKGLDDRWKPLVSPRL